jgi:hypothetical protein
VSSTRADQSAFEGGLSWPHPPQAPKFCTLAVVLLALANCKTSGAQVASPAAVPVLKFGLTVTPSVIQPANGKLPASVNMAIFELGCDQNNGTDLTEGAGAPYTITITGSGITPSSPPGVAKCALTSTLTIDPNASVGLHKVILNDKAGIPVGAADLSILDSAAGPIPPGLSPEVDAMWEVMSQKNCSDAFGRRVQVFIAYR